MARIILQIVSVILILVGASAVAQEKEVPGTKQQVMLSYAPLVKKISPAVVNIYAKRVVTRNVSPFAGDPFFDRFWGGAFGQRYARRELENMLGSGLIVEPDGIVVTNAHVVKDAQEISTVLSDGREFDAKVLLTDKPTDLAVLKIEADGEELPSAHLKPSELLEVGDIVLAIGNPFGVGQTVTSGIVSALARSSLDISDYNFFIQTDAAINPGNSGGPLVAMDGGVVGINTAIYSRTGSSTGIGFSIPSEMVVTVITAAKNGEVGDQGVPRPWMGVSAQTVTSDIAETLNLNKPTGVLITKIHKASPLHQAGVKIGDLVTKMNGKTIRDAAEMKFRLATVALDEEATLEVLRDGKRMDYSFKAIKPPEDPPRNETLLKGVHPLNGVTISNLNPALAIQLGMDTSSEGIVVTSVVPRSRASFAVKVGDIIESINNKKIRTVKDLKKIEKSKASSWGFVIVRNGQRRQLVVR